jgi:hypothetical protein
MAGLDLSVSVATTISNSAYVLNAGLRAGRKLRGLRQREDIGLIIDMFAKPADGHWV